MASLTLRGLNDRFPEGTSLGAYPLSNWTPGQQPAAGTAPIGSATATASVSSDAAAFTGLADDTAYIVTDSSGTKFVRAFTSLNHGQPVKSDANGKVPWALLAGSEFHVKDAAYGAKLDGTTNDTTAVQNAINDAANVAPSTVVVEGGLALVTNLTPKTGVSIVGRNGGGFKATVGNLNPIIYRQNTSSGTVENVTFKDLRFQGELSPASPSAQVAIYMRAAASGLNKNIRVLDCTFDDFKSSAIYIFEAQQVQIRGNTVRNCATAAGGRNAINVGVDTTSGAQDAALIGEFVVADNVVDGPVTAAINVDIIGTGFSARGTVTGNVCKAGGSNGFAGIACESNGSHHHVPITGNTLLDFQTGVDIANTAGTSPQTADYRGFVVTGNTIDSAVTGGYGVRCQGSNAVIGDNSIRTAGKGVFATGIDGSHRANSQTVSDNQIVGNNSSGADYLIHLQSSDGSTVTGNRMSWESGATGRGMFLSDCAAPHVLGNHVTTPQRHGIDATDCPDGVFSNNVILDCSTQTSNTYSGIVHAGNVGSGLTLSDNVIHDRRGGSAKMKYGMEFTAGGSTGTPVKLLANTILGFVTGSVNGRALVTVDFNNVIDTKGSAYWDDFDGEVGPFAPSCRGWNFGSTGAVTQTRIYGARFYCKRDILVTNIRFVVQVAASQNHTVDVGIWDTAGSTKQASSGATTGKLNSTGAKSVNLSAAYQMKAGTVYHVGVRSTDPGALGGTAATLSSATFSNGFAGQFFGAFLPQVLFGSVDDATVGLPTSLGAYAASGNFTAALAVCEA